MIGTFQDGEASSPKNQPLTQDGWMAADLHVHTLCSPDVLPSSTLHPKALYSRAKKLGFGFITFTDHNTMSAYDHIGWKREGLVTGVEISIKDMDLVGHTIHVNVYDLDLEQFHELKSIASEGDLLSFLDCAKRDGLPCVYNHPLWFEPGERPNLAAIPEVITLFSVIEYNMYRIKRKNEIAIELSKRFGRGLVAATDTHSGQIGKCYTLSQGDDFRDYFKNIERGRSRVFIKDMTKQDFVEEINTWIDLIFSHDLLPGVKDFSTGIFYIDAIIHALAGETIRGFPRLWDKAFGFCRRISNSGVPASLYLQSEAARLGEIENLLSDVLDERMPLME